MSLNFSADSEYGQQLKAQIASRLRGMNLSEDPDYVAEFLLVLISNGRSGDEILQEFKGLFGDAIDASFIGEVLAEVQNHQAPKLPSQIMQEAPIPVMMPVVEQQQQQQQQQQQPPQNSQPAVQSAFGPSAFQPTHPIPTGPAGAGLPSMPKVRFDEPGTSAMEVEEPYQSEKPLPFGNSNSRLHGGISKGGKAGSSGFKGKKSFALRNQRNFQDLVGRSMENNGAQTTTFTPRKPIGRCKKFPNCPDRHCRYAHPMKMCFAFPNCPNAPGTCNYLHPGEDDDLIAAVEKINEARRAQRIERNNNMVKQVSRQVEQRLLQQTNGITLCKFGAVCQREMCPFGHPTPANKDAKVLTMEWCPANKNCTDPQCTKAHSSPNFQPPNKGAGAGAGAAAGGDERVLEQCKFGKRCHVFHCPKRHATTHVLCRDGANCMRIDCFFMHPLDEDCKFGVNCHNRNCPYRHPEGRSLGADGSNNNNMVWVNQGGSGSGDSTGTDQRHFAVPEDQVMEQAPPQSA